MRQTSRCLQSGGSRSHFQARDQIFGKHGSHGAHGRRKSSTAPPDRRRSSISIPQSRLFSANSVPRNASDHGKATPAPFHREDAKCAKESQTIPVPKIFTSFTKNLVVGHFEFEKDPLPKTWRPFALFASSRFTRGPEGFRSSWRAGGRTDRRA